MDTSIPETLQLLNLNPTKILCENHRCCYYYAPLKTTDNTFIYFNFSILTKEYFSINIKNKHKDLDAFRLSINIKSEVFFTYFDILTSFTIASDIVI